MTPQSAGWPPASLAVFSQSFCFLYRLIPFPLRPEYSFLQDSAQAHACAWPTLSPLLCEPQLILQGAVQMSLAGRRKPCLSSLDTSRALIEHLLCAGPWVRLWGTEMRDIPALRPEVQGRNTVGRSDKAGGPWECGWEAAEEVGSDSP